MKRFTKYLNKKLTKEIAREIVQEAMDHHKETNIFDFKESFYILKNYREDNKKHHPLALERIEFTLEKYAIGFANVKGGFLIYGVKEYKNSFTIKGLSFDLFGKQNLKNIIKKKLKTISQRHSLNIESKYILIDNKEILVIKYPKRIGFKFLCAKDGSCYLRRKDQLKKLNHVPFYRK